MLHLLLTRGLAVVCAASFIESLGAPVPAFPLLLLAGSIAAEHRLSAVPLVVASACGFWIGDLIWYAFGRIQGRRVLGLLCRLSLNPDACVGRAERRFRRRPAMTVAAAKFIPGFSLMVAPLAGILRMPPVQFAAIDGAASIAWSAAAVMSGVCVRQTCPSACDAHAASDRHAGRRRRSGLCRVEAVREALARSPLLVARVEIRRTATTARLGSADGPRDRPAKRTGVQRVCANGSQGRDAFHPVNSRNTSTRCPLDKEIILYCT